MADGGTKLNEEQLFQCLKSLNVPFRMNDLKTPTRDFVIRVFECFLKDLQIDIYSAKLRPWEVIKHIDNPEMYEDAQLLLFLTSSVSLIMQPLGLHINIRDITDPKPKRTKKILNYLIVFWNFFLKKYSRFETVADSFQRVKEVIDELVKDNETLEENLQNCMFKIKNMKPCKSELIQIVSAKEKEIDKLSNRKEVLSFEYQELKKNENELTSQMSDTALDIASAKELINELDQQILTSPEKFSNDIQKLKDQVKDVEAKLIEKQNELKEKSKSIGNLVTIQKNNARDLEILHSIETLVQEYGELKASMMAKEKECEEEEEKVKKLQADLDMKGDSQNYYELKAAKIRMYTLQKKESFLETIQKLDKQIEEVKKHLDALKNRNIKIKQSIDEIRTDCKELSSTCDQAEVELLNIIEKHEKKADDIVNTFQQAIYETKMGMIKVFEKN